MRRVLPLLLPLFLLAGLRRRRPAAAPGPIEQVHAGFARGGLVDIIAIDAVDRLPLRAAALVSPDGSTTPAGDIDVVASPTVATGQWVAGDPWRSAWRGAGPPPR